MKFLDVAIIGAGPYGLSIAAHLTKAGIGHRIFGTPMESWDKAMPKGMALKSDGQSSDISDPDGTFTLKAFCQSQGYPHHDTQRPIPVEVFTEYGLAFQKRFATVEQKRLVTLKALTPGFLLGFDDGELLTARQVVLAMGITPFARIPAIFQDLPADRLTHSNEHGPIADLAGRRVAVIGAGSSALDLAALLHEQDSDVFVTARSNFEFHGRPNPRALWRRLLRPGSGIGNGWPLRVFSDAPLLFHALPQEIRLGLVGRLLGPSGGWFIKDRLRNVEMRARLAPVSAKRQGNGVELRFAGSDGREWRDYADHVIAATGYKIDLKHLPFLPEELLVRLRRAGGAPVLSERFESSWPGLFFVGPVSMNCFGPLVRFVFGAAFTARSITRGLAQSRRAVYVAQQSPAKA